jgi:hypothetical protein
MRQKNILKRLALVLLATVAIVIVNIGALAIFFYSKGQVDFSSITSSLWFMLMLEGPLIALMGCLMIIPMGGYTGGPSGGRGIPRRHYIPPERGKKSFPYAYDMIAVGILLFVLSLIVSLANL